jgi:superfamily II DNA/RNA helicase
MRFDEFDLCDQLLEAISYMGFEKASPVQEQAIPVILENRDIIAFAQTGTGKTAAFVLPILHKIVKANDGGINSLIVVPTRELAIQIEQQIQGFSYFLPVNSVAIYGGGDGNDWSQEEKALKNDVDIIVATPGRLISHLNTGKINFEKLKHLVLDEADRMLDMGFFDDIMKIVSYLPKKGRQTMMFSATMPHKIKKMAQTILHNPFEISIQLSKPAEGVIQEAYLVHEEQKNALITSILSKRSDFTSVLIFTSTKIKVNKIVSGLRGKGYRVEGISSDLDQKRREEVLSEFRSRKARVLVATDVLSRGIDIKEIGLIINYDVPHDAEDYVHRVGRTARAETTGVAITLITKAEIRKFTNIEKLIGKEIPKISLPPELGNVHLHDTQPTGQTPRFGGKKFFNKKRNSDN